MRVLQILPKVLLSSLGQYIFISLGSLWMLGAFMSQVFMYVRVWVSICTVCLYEGCEPSSLSIAALMSPPVAMRACRLASRLMKPMALSWSSWDWNRTSGVWVYRRKDNVTSKKKEKKITRVLKMSYQ